MTRGLTRWWIRPVVALGLWLAAFVMVVHAQGDVGIARDETVYMGHGSKYARWWLDTLGGKDGMVSEKGITASWGGKGATDNNREHPPLMKTAFGLSEIVLHDKLGVASEVTAYRVPTAAMFAWLVVVVFFWAAQVWGTATGVIAALLTLFLPRAFFHAGLAAFDAPIATLWVATIYAYWRSVRSPRWAIAAGVLFGLALATKHNALLLPFALAPHFVYVVVRRVRAGEPLGRVWVVAPAMAILGPLVLVALWPWLWFDTVAHVRDWLKFHMNHVHYNFEYLGENWNAPPFPWHVALVTTLLTVPAATLAPTAAVLRERWTFPWLEPAAIALAGALVVLPAAIETLHAQPRALTHYNAIAGGAPGGADLGMNRQFWGESARGVLPFLRSRPTGPVYSHDASPAWGIYFRDKRLPPTMRDAGREEAGIASSQLAIVIHELHFNRHDYLIWKAYGTVQPVFVLRVDGVPVVSVYERAAR
ncbi:MAG: glycosyltransferase family 39 protein [Deltaproteobacteria bacterium]|nr:glycosyltransferase family 39 protein [Kofleriaceae bacterium]